jgi:hypothetical protein
MDGTGTSEKCEITWAGIVEMTLANKAERGVSDNKP